MVFWLIRLRPLLRSGGVGESGRAKLDLLLIRLPGSGGEERGAEERRA